MYVCVCARACVCTSVRACMRACACVCARVCCACLYHPLLPPPPPPPTLPAFFAFLLHLGQLWPKIHGYTRCKRTGVVKPDSVKLAMGHLLHGEAAPLNRALQTPVPLWIQGLMRRVPCIRWSVAVDPLSATAVPPHLNQFAVPFVQIVTTVCLQGT